jgi:hypothetical protein
MHGVLHGVGASLRQVQPPQLWVNFLKVGNRRHQTGFQRLHCQHIFNAGAHGVTGQAFGVGDDDLIGVATEDAPQCVDFCRSAAATRGRVSFVGNENHLRGDLVAGDAAAGFGL